MKEFEKYEYKIVICIQDKHKVEILKQKTQLFYGSTVLLRAGTEAHFPIFPMHS